MTASLPLTSMLEFLVVTVVFLLLAFSPGEAAAAKDVHLPPAGNTLDMIDAPMLTIAWSLIPVDGSAAGDTRGIEEHGQLAGLDELAMLLETKRTTWKQLHPGRAFPARWSSRSIRMSRVSS